MHYKNIKLQVIIDHANVQTSVKYTSAIKNEKLSLCKYVAIVYK